MTPVRACQIAAKLLEKLDGTYKPKPSELDQLVPVSIEERNAIFELQRIAARVACGHFQRGDGTLRIPR